MLKPLYVDYAATTPVDPHVAEKMQACLGLEGTFANPASTHVLGRKANALIEQARVQVAALIHADPREIIWTSGATEADNLVLKGVAHFYQDKGKHIITSKTEHKAVLDTCQQLEAEGYSVTYLQPQASGLLDLNELAQAITPATLLVSIMHVNNETGVIQDIASIGAICREQNVFLHVDAAQSVGKLPIDVMAQKVDLMSFSAHKIYGPKGMGALFVKRKPKVRLAALIHGGGHEQGLRSGTLATHQIVGMGAAFALAQAELSAEQKRMAQLRKKLIAGLAKIPQITFNGAPEHTLANIINFSVAGVDGEALMLALKDLALSSGSACTAASIDASYVLRAMGVPEPLAHTALRFSMGRFTTTAEIDYAIDYLQTRIAWLRGIAPEAIYV